jgi:hypothetical protein
MRRYRALACFLIVLCALLASLHLTEGRVGKQGTGQSRFRFPLVGQFVFEHEVVRGSLQQADIARLLDLNLQTGQQKHALYMTSNSDTIVQVQTCREWQQAKSHGFTPLDNVRIWVESFFIHTCGFLYALQDAKLAKDSFVAKPRIGLSHLHLLPARMLSPMAGKDTMVQGATIETLVATGEVHIKKKTATALQLIYTPEGMEGDFAEVGRADFDGDGVEDIFVNFSMYYVTQGTLRAYDNFLLTRHKASEVLSVRCGQLC